MHIKGLFLAVFKNIRRSSDTFSVFVTFFRIFLKETIMLLLLRKEFKVLKTRHAYFDQQDIKLHLKQFL